MTLVTLSPEEQKHKDELLSMLGEHIHIMRIKRKLKQKDVADRCGFSRSGYNQIEKGLRNVSFYSLYKISKVLEVPLESLMKIPGVDGYDLFDK